MQILVVGGAGYIGAHVNRALHQIGHSTIVLDNLSRGHREFVRWGKFIQGDIADIEILDRVFSENAIDVVMHFSAFAYVGESSVQPDWYYRNNVSNTIHLLDAMVKHQVKSFVFSSSCATFGEAVYLPIDETHPQNPINPYGRSKWMVEKILEDYQAAFGLNSVILRYFNAAGASPNHEIGEFHEPETHLIPLVLDVALRKRDAIRIFGNDYPTVDGTCVRDYIHVCDLADAHIRAMDWMIANRQSNHFNLGGGQGYSVQELIDLSERITGCEIPRMVVPRRPGDPAVLTGDSTKAGEILHWKPQYNIESILKHAWNWHLFCSENQIRKAAS